MFTIHKLIRDEDGMKKEQFVLYQYLNRKNYDLEFAIHMAVLEYCATADGMRTQYSKTGFTYQDFVDRVPNSICEKHGFLKTIINDEAELIDRDLLIAEKMEVKSYLHGCEKNDAEWDMTVQVFYDFETKVRKWKPELMEKNPKEMTSKILFWARKFAQSYIVNNDYHRDEFLQERLKEIEKENSLSKRAAQ